MTPILAAKDNRPNQTQGNQMSNELAVRGSRPMLTKDILQDESDQRKLLMQYVEQQMVLDTDYGVIPGTKNRTLLKPGAEKLTDLFRCVPQFEIIEKIEDWDKGLFNYQFKCSIVVRETGMVVAEGYGSCSTFEGKYRWRNSERKCPNCGKAAIIKGKAEFGGGWLCWAKRDGCGSKFGDNDKSITDQVVEKIQNPDIADCVNTVLKMAKKRAHVDAAISLARCSDMFTQDAEDLPVQDSVPAKQQGKPADKKEEPTKKPPATTKKTETQLDKVLAWWVNTSFEHGDDPDDTAQIRFGKRLSELRSGYAKFCTCPKEPPANDVDDWVRHGLQMGDQQEYADMSIPQLRNAETMVVNWLKLCKPK